MFIKNCLLIKDPGHKFGVTQVVGICPACGKQWKLCVLTDSLEKYIKGEPIEEVFSGLSAQSRELLISGTCELCWEKQDVSSITEEK